MEREQAAFKESTLEFSLSFDESLLVSHTTIQAQNLINFVRSVRQCLIKKWNLLSGTYVKGLLHKMSTDSLEVISTWVRVTSSFNTAVTLTPFTPELQIVSGDFDRCNVNTCSLTHVVNIRSDLCPWVSCAHLNIQIFQSDKCGAASGEAYKHLHSPLLITLLRVFILHIYCSVKK